MKNNIIRFTVSTVINIAYLIFYWFIGYEINTPIYHSREYYIIVLVVCGFAVAGLHLLAALLLRKIRVSDNLSRLFIIYTVVGIIPFFWMLSAEIVFSPVGIGVGAAAAGYVIYKKTR